MAAFPMNKPQYVILALLDEPKGTRRTGYLATGGWVAAPVVSAVVKRIAPMLGLTPEGQNDKAMSANGQPLRVKRVTGDSKTMISKR